MPKYAVYFEQINQTRIVVKAIDRDMAGATAMKQWYDESRATIITIEELEKGDN